MHEEKVSNLELNYVALREQYNDLRIVAGTDVSSTGFTLFAILRNEMYFLEHFFSHYRMLGVERFIFLNDRSDDGSFEYLLQQPDTIIVESDRSYGDTVRVSQRSADQTTQHRMIHLWRGMLHDLFAKDKWALQVDLDEFVHLPDNTTFQGIIAKLENQPSCVVWGVMLDAYPKDIAEFVESENTTRFNPSTTWYFDGERHLHLRRNKVPRVKYPGARARLYRAYGIDKLYRDLGLRLDSQAVQLLKKIVPGAKVRGYNALFKPTLIKWKNSSYFKNSHNTNLPASSDYLLPIQHYRFAGSLSRKVQVGLLEQSYYLGSRDHRFLAELLRIMNEKNGSFLYSRSRSINSYDDFLLTGNAIGL